MHYSQTLAVEWGHDLKRDLRMFSRAAPDNSRHRGDTDCGNVEIRHEAEFINTLFLFFWNICSTGPETIGPYKTQCT